MPLDIDIKQIEYNVSVQFSRVTELLAAMHMLCDKRHHDFDPLWFKHVVGSLSPKSRELIEHLSKLNFPGLELFDFIVLEKADEDINDFIDRLRQYDSLEFLHIMLDKKISKDQLLAAKKDNAVLDSIRDQIPWVLNGSEDFAAYMAANVENYKDIVVDLLTEIYEAGFEDKLTELHERYSEAAEDMEHRLKGRNPVELAEEIKGSKFPAKHNFKQDIFSPSYFL
ncbi:MAG: hypothetical protein K0R84_1355, partial [Clostridia bacterium]|nr:hypothetical protein [Clostridia bacterium]